MAKPRPKGGIRCPILRGKALRNDLEGDMDMKGWVIGDSDVINPPSTFSDPMENLYNSN